MLVFLFATEYAINFDEFLGVSEQSMAKGTARVNCQVMSGRALSVQVTLSFDYQANVLSIKFL